MNYFIQKLIILSLLFFTTLQVEAYVPQRGNINVLLSGYSFQSQIKSSTLLSDVDVNGFGLTAIGDVSPRGSLEISSIFLNKTFYRSTDDMSLKEESKVVHVTMGYRHWWKHWFSSSFSFFTAYPMGTMTVLDSRNAASDFETSAHEKSQSGLDLALQAELYSKGRWGVQTEARYSYYITKLSGEDPHQLGLSLGVRYFLQSRVAKPREYKQLNNENN